MIDFTKQELYWFFDWSETQYDKVRLNKRQCATINVQKYETAESIFRKVLEAKKGIIEFTREELLVICNWLTYKAGYAMNRRRLQEYKTIQSIREKISNELCEIYAKREG